MYKTKRRLQKNYDTVVDKHNFIDSRSTYNIEYRYIEKDFEFRLLSFYIKFKSTLSLDIISVIFKYIITLIYDKYLIYHYECVCLTNSKNYHKYPIFRDGFTGVLDFYNNKNTNYELKFVPNCFVCFNKRRCSFLDCQSHILNSNYCRLHMNCKCGYNRRLESCKTKHV